MPRSQILSRINFKFNLKARFTVSCTVSSWYVLCGYIPPKINLTLPHVVDFSSSNIEISLSRLRSAHFSGVAPFYCLHGLDRTSIHMNPIDHHQISSIAIPYSPVCASHKIRHETGKITTRNLKDTRDITNIQNRS